MVCEFIKNNLKLLEIIDKGLEKVFPCNNISPYPGGFM